uniref:Uncharacterized protein n=1 Tax=Tetranychus urticae TaxID=32264 RepID=T1KV46_TETUR
MEKLRISVMHQSLLMKPEESPVFELILLLLSNCLLLIDSEFKSDEIFAVDGEVKRAEVVDVVGDENKDDASELIAIAAVSWLICSAERKDKADRADAESNEEEEESGDADGVNPEGCTNNDEGDVPELIASVYSGLVWNALGFVCPIGKFETGSVDGRVKRLDDDNDPDAEDGYLTLGLTVGKTVFELTSELFGICFESFEVAGKSDKAKLDDEADDEDKDSASELNFGLLLFCSILDTKLSCEVVESDDKSIKEVEEEVVVV